MKGTTVSTYSWTTSGLNIAARAPAPAPTTSSSNGPAPRLATEVESVTLTVTNSSSQQESETFYFVVPTSNVGHACPPARAGPMTIPPDLEEPGAPSIASQGVSVDADSGALDTDIDLPSYNPNVPALSLTYNSMTANPLPIVVVHHTLDPTQTVPTAVNATLTFNSVAGTTWYYNTSSFIPGDVQQIALQANATSLSTGRYGYSVQVVDERSTNTTFTYTGTATVLNQSTSAFGDGWTLEGLEQVIPLRQQRRDPQPGRQRREPLVRGQSRRRQQLHDPGGRLLDADQDQQRLHAHADRRHPDHVQLQRLRDRHDRPQQQSHDLLVQRLNQLTTIDGSVRQRHDVHLQLGQPAARSRTRPAG